MSTVPVPKPRALAPEKRPVPLPRTRIPKTKCNETTQTDETQTNNSTLRRISTTSKQIIDEISEVLQKNLELGKRSISKKHSKAFLNDAKIIEEDKVVQTSPEIFDNIRFESPITISRLSRNSSYTEENSLYANTNNVIENESDEDHESLPPPRHPPPPLPDTSYYDTPSKSSDNSASRPIPIPLPAGKPSPLKPTLVSPKKKDQPPGIPPIPQRLKYEAVFPVYPVFSHESDSENSGGESKTGTLGRTEIVRPESWNFYDPVTLNDATYSNIKKNDRRSIDSESGLNTELSLLYENYLLNLQQNDIQPEEQLKKTPRPSKSTIFEFDPLVNAQPGTSTQNFTRNALDDLLELDLYGTNLNIQPNYDQYSISEESETDECLNPPTPPERVDSLADENPPENPKISNTNWYTSDSDFSIDTKKTGWMTKINDVLKKVPESARNIRAGLQKDKFLDRPSLNSRVLQVHKGILFRISSKSVEDLFGEFHYRWLVSSSTGLVFYADNIGENPKENIPLDTILSVQLAPEKKYKLEKELYCFELNTTSNHARGSYVYGVPTASECKHWMQKIAESLTNRFPLNILMEYTRMGWTYLREGITGMWAGAWIILSKRNLYYALDGVQMCTIDLRKASCIQLQDVDNDSPRTSDSRGPNLIIHCPEQTIYLRMWTARETKLWCSVTRNVAFKNGLKLDEQQLTKDNVPVIVEKCMNFIYVNGSMSEGIYRRSGRSVTVNELLKFFQNNAWAVSLTTEKYTEHDVANVLKRFFRDLPEQLLTKEKSQYLCQIANAYADNTEKVKMYSAILEQFPATVYFTLKKILGHLHFIQSQAVHNKMTARNLAAIWGPTLVHHEGIDSELSNVYSTLLMQLIELYRNLFPATPEEILKEKMMLDVLKRNFTGQGPQRFRASGDLRVWVHLLAKNGETVFITISPQRLAGDVCIELSEKLNLPAYELQLEEWVLNDNLRRPIHYSERVLEVVLRWGYWDETDRKDNCLVITTMQKYKPFDKPTNSSIISEELKFADNKTKNYKNFTFKFEQAKLCYYKTMKQNVQVKIQEWNIEDILWYFGFEPRHNPQTKWAITFILRKQPPNRTRDCPYFGYTIAGNDVAMRSKWVSTMIRAEHNNGLAPPLRNLTSVSLAA